MSYQDNLSGTASAQYFPAVPPEYSFNSSTGAIPREIIRWLQSLDVLTPQEQQEADRRGGKRPSVVKPVRHTKRDFANGFHVARICSKFVSTVDMNNYDDVSSAARKMQNWAMLQRSLRAASVPTFTDQHIADVMAAKDGAADDMLLMLYQKFAGRGLPGQSAATKGGPMSQPQPLDHVPQFIKTTAASAARDNDGAAAGGGPHATEATKQLSAMAAEQLRAAELELLKQMSDTNLRAEIIGLADDNNNTTNQQQRGGADGGQQTATKARHIPRAPAVPQPLVQGQIRAVDAAAESEDKAILFNQVSMRQLSGAALQRFGFRDRSQSPSARGGTANSNSPRSGRAAAAAAAAASGRGGVGVSIHSHICILLDRFVADFFTASTTWNPPADGSPLSYFIENCGNTAVISGSFKANLWAYLSRDAATTAAVLAAAPMDALFFVAHFANVSVEQSVAPPPGDTSYGDLWKPKFFGADALDSTLYCHKVLGALHKQKRATAESIMRRYALPAMLPMFLLRGGVAAAAATSSSSSVSSSYSASLRRAVFAVSSLALGNHLPAGINSIASSLRYFAQPLALPVVEGGAKTSAAAVAQSIRKESHIAGDVETGALLSAQERDRRVQSLCSFADAIYDTLVGNFDATVQFASKLFAAEEINARLFTASAVAAAAGAGVDPAGCSTTSRPSLEPLLQKRPASSGIFSGSASGVASDASAAFFPAQQIPSAAPVRTTECFNAWEALLDSLRGDIPPQKLYATEAPVPPPLALFLVRHIERVLIQQQQQQQSLLLCPPVPVACAAIKCLAAMARSGAVRTVPEVSALVQQQLREVLAPALKGSDTSSASSLISSPVSAVSSSPITVELVRLLCCTLRCTSRSNSSSCESDKEAEFGNNNSSSSSSSSSSAQLLQRLFISAGEDILGSQQKRNQFSLDLQLVLASAVASALSNFDLPSSSSASSSATAQKSQQQQQPPLPVGLAKPSDDVAANGSNNTSGNLDTALPPPATTSARAASADQAGVQAKRYADTFNGLANFCIDTLLGLPPAALEVFGFSGGNLARALPLILNSSNSASTTLTAAALANPLDCSRWNTVALLAAINGRFLAHNAESAATSHKIAGPGKTGSAGVLKLPSAPAGFGAAPTAPEHSAFLRPYRAVLLLFTLLLAKHTDVQNSSVILLHRENEDIVALWQMLAPSSSSSAGRSSSNANASAENFTKQESARDVTSIGSASNFLAASSGTLAAALIQPPTIGTELKKLLLYYDGARKGAASVAPRTSSDSETLHEVYVQAGRAALFIVVKLWGDILSASASTAALIPSQLQPYVGPTLTALANRVALPAAKALEDDAALGQQGLDVAVRAMEWFMNILSGKTG